MKRDVMTVDILVVGAGVAGLATAIRLAQLSQQAQLTLNIAIIEKSAHVGEHIISGAIIEPRGLTELFPDWQQQGAPLHTAVTTDRFLWLTQNRAWRLPTLPTLQNRGNYIASLGSLCRWLAKQAEQLGINIFTGFAARDVIFNDNNQVCGVITGDMGRDKQGNPGQQFQSGIALQARYTVFAEGAHGSLSKQLIQHYQLNKHSDPQTYALGLKEIWHIPKAQHHAGQVTHTIGWPLDKRTYGGSFIYHYATPSHPYTIAVGLVIGLDYVNPYFDPFAEFQRFKTHPFIKKILQDGERIYYGARALTEGGLQAIPNCIFPGGVLVGCSAGFMNVAKMKGSHTAIKSGICAAEAIFRQLQSQQFKPVLQDYPNLLQNSWLQQELHLARNIRPAFSRWGTLGGLVYTGFDQLILRGHAPWTLHHRTPDHCTLQPKTQHTPINYPKPDNVTSFDKASSVYLTHLHYSENQPCHLVLGDQHIAINSNYAVYDSPETRYCPAGVYEIIFNENNQPHLQINATNCIHCKTCDIKDPKQNINWVPPQGGEGPNYQDM